MANRREFLAQLVSLTVAGGAMAAPARETAGTEFRIRGVNYVPSYAASPYEAWVRYDGETIRRELGWAAGLGLNTVRVTLSYEACRQAPTAYAERLDEFLEEAGQAGLRVMPVLFDAWGVAPTSYLGREEETLAEAIARIEAHPSAYEVDEAALERYRVTARQLLPDRRVPRAGDASVLLWGRWTPSPEPERVGPSYWSLYRHYVHTVMGAWGGQASVVAWDVMNNPTLGRSLRPRRDPEEGHRFVALALEEAKRAGATQPLTVSFAAGYGSIGPYVRDLDLLATQSMTGASRDVQRSLLEMKSLSRGRPVVLTVGGGAMLPGRSEEAGEASQAERVRQTIDAAEREAAGWLLWHLVEGECMTPWAGLFRRDGGAKAAAEVVRREVRSLR